MKNIALVLSYLLVQSMAEAEVNEIKSVINAQKSKAKLSKPFHALHPPKDLHAHVTPEDFLKSFPNELFTQDAVLAHRSLAVTLFCMFLSITVLVSGPWFVWPFAWVVAGAGATGLFIIGHDCAHNLFSESSLVNDVVGAILMLPLGYSYKSYKIYHLANQRTLPKSTNSLVNGIWGLAHGPTFWFASIGYWGQHFEISHYKPEDRPHVLGNNYFLLAGFFAFLSSFYWCADFTGVLKLWFVPWLTFHILLSTATLLPLVIFGEKPPAPVHIVYPEWLEYLTGGFNMLLPRRVASNIPHYRVHAAYQVLKQQWGDHFLEIKVNWEIVVQLFGKPVAREDFVPLSYSHVFSSSNFPHTEKRCLNPLSAAKQWRNAIAQFFATVNFLHGFWATLFPICLAAYGFLYIKPHMYTIIWTMLCGFGSMHGISAGYHRLWSHKAYSARTPTKVVLLLLGTCGMQRSVLWWAQDHRAHHKYTDTDWDPYNAKRGFWYSHFGWTLFKSEPSESTRLPINMDDLYKDPLLRWQYDYFVPLSIFVGMIFPSGMCYLWEDLAGGICYNIGVRILVVHHAIYFVNSLAHYWGEAPYADEHTSRDSFLAAILTLGEGYHNFHHEFPFDYRNGAKFYQWDPNKWIIAGLSYVGQTYDLKITPERLIKKCELQMQQKKVKEFADKEDWGITNDVFPTISRATFDKLAAEGFKLIIIQGGIYDVSDFFLEHPGGTKVMESFFGKDATNAFTGGIYKHSNAARNRLLQYQIGICAEEDDWLCENLSSK
eukprot:Phypoly_transcript_03715.p1 GENE.Phypoly_transcript_03715~~Phypoly_transcript_03715.p1  ORF type:complete len:771 (+),score=67.31 Phypoly_transcript_03715:41-2353(+)